ncbi:MAG TPA: hypothetical protein VKC60_10965 [Opitutaceae bacterium]|nr:hypothetical protein [Opitutaceae bacterium]
MDDDINIYANPNMGGLDWHRLEWMFTNHDYVRRYMPLGWFAYSVLYSFFGLSAAGYHLANVLFHAANTFLLYLLLIKLGHMWLGERLDAWFIAVVGMGAAFWSFHPLRVESIGWVSGLLYSQAGFFSLVALLLYLRTLDDRLRGWRRIGWLLVSSLAYTISLLTYPIGVGLVVLPPLIDVAFLMRSESEKIAWWRDPRFHRLLREKIVFVAPALFILALTVQARLQGSASFWGKPPSLAEFTVLARGMQAFYIWAYYVWRPFWLLHFTPAYSTLFEFNPLAPPFILSACFVLVLTGGLILKFRSWCVPAMFWLAHLVILIPMLGLTEHPHFASDRYDYFPGMVLTAFLVWAAMKIRGYYQRSGVVLTGLLAIVILALVSSRQLEVWRDSGALFTHMISQTKNEEIMGANIRQLALYHYSRGEKERAWAIIAQGERSLPSQDQLKVARNRISEMDKLNKSISEKCSAAPLAILHWSLAGGFRHKGEWEEAVDHLREALLLSPDFAEASFDFALMQASRGNASDALHKYVALAASDFFKGRANSETVLLKQMSLAFSAQSEGRVAALIEKRVKAIARQPGS